MTRIVEPVYRKIGKRMRCYRERQGMTQYEVAIRSGTSRAQIAMQNKEAAESVVSPEEIKTLMDRRHGERRVEMRYDDLMKRTGSDRRAS